MERHTYIRLAKIDELIRGKRYPNCRKMAEEFEVSQRTILRDIEAMKDSLGAPILFSKEKNGYYYGSSGFSLPELKLSEGELLAVLLGAEIMSKYKNTPFEAAISRAFEKLQLLLPNSVTINPTKIDEFISFDIRQTRELDKESAKVFEVLVKAIKDKNGVEVNYYVIGRNAMQKRVIDPYHLRHTQGSWYLIGYCHLRKDIRTFSVNQIKGIKALPQKFEVQKDFSVEKFFADSWSFQEGGSITKVVVKLDKAVARWFVDRKLHASQQTKENKDGSLTLTFKVAGTNEIKRWILSQGHWAKMIEPESLRKEIREETRRMYNK
ncbi:MAG: regulatory protein DeoR [Candidatus Saganbacteria bacterium]|uniref:Regulatory protein DeoR n=1 Tax=Candidatus Saganbacteria bacterium TaxID=2575572 RepID=A0A833L030_UNCSA|nr:MAG: regulatory protein DeoR [Candidatus Saganbacteria bacterium]